MTQGLPPEDRLDQLASKQELAELSYKYARAIDRADGPVLKSCYHADAIHDHNGVFTGNAHEFADFIMTVKQQQAGATVHEMSNLLFVVDGDEAVGEIYLSSYNELKGSADGMVQLIGGRYLDQYERRGGIWKILHRRVIFDWVETFKTTDSWAQSFAAGGPRGLPSREDASYELLPSNMLC
ncbi:nuclear transport factor 2 family protein [Marinicaulis aureus]|uniref:Nuclear transport factor 2 family protein n=1 Tax=Hyphococcus aureus TaxID=2666033 RepID=A0ABW1KU24_9PROT